MARHFTLNGIAPLHDPSAVEWADAPIRIHCTISETCRRPCEHCNMGHLIDMMMDPKYKFEEVKG